MTRLQIIEVEGRAGESAFVGKKPAMDFIFRCRRLGGLRFRDAGHFWHIDALVPWCLDLCPQTPAGCKWCLRYLEPGRSDIDPEAVQMRRT